MNPYLAWPRSAKVAAVLFMVIASGFILIAAKEILIPIALAVLLAFSLHPLVKRLHRAGLNRVIAVLLVVGFATISVAGVGYVVSSQLKAFADELPAHEATIATKVRSVKQMFHGGTLDRLSAMVHRINKSTQPHVPSPAAPTNAEPGDPEQGSNSAIAAAGRNVLKSVHEEESSTQNPAEMKATETPVVKTAAPSDSVSVFGTSLVTNPLVESVFEALATAGIVVLLVTFFLIQQADIRDRLVSVAGRGALATTTKALEEAGSRISRYLLMLCMVNLGYGITVALGLWLMGVPYALMWGLAAGVTRFVPYVGPWVGAAMPITVSLATSQGWSQPLMVIGMFVVLELLSGNVVEPLVYGHSVGISEVGVILSAVVWAWLWGPIGLVLATPMTVCLVVLGRYVPGLRVFDHLLGERADVSPFVRLYQRLLAKDSEDVELLVQQYLAEHTPVEAADNLLVPAVELIRQDLTHDQINETDSEQMNAILRDVIDEKLTQPAEAEKAEQAPLVIGVAAHADEEAILLDLLNAVCGGSSGRVEVISSGLLQSERLAEIVEKSPELVVVSALPPGDLPYARQFCKRLKAIGATRRVVVARWGRATAAPDRNQALLASGADEVVSTIAELEPIIKTAFHIHQASRAAASQSPPATRATVQAG